MTRTDERGFSLIEAVVAISLLTIGVSAVCQVALYATRANVLAQQAGVAQRAAREKLEQLRALAWGIDADGTLIQDTTSDLTTRDPVTTGGLGLTASSSLTVSENVAGYCDFLDERGDWVGSGVLPPSAAWIRRWSVRPLDGLPDTLFLQVVVLPARRASESARLTSARAANGAWLVDMYTRRMR